MLGQESPAGSSLRYLSPGKLSSSSDSYIFIFMLGQNSPAGSSLRYLSPGMLSSSSDSDDDNCNDYVYQLQVS